MKKIILSAAVAAMALTTAASALEDIKVNGQAKLWYETRNQGDFGILNKDGAIGSVIFKLGVTGKQGNVGFGATVYQASTMGLETVLVNNVVTTQTTQVVHGDLAGVETAAGQMYTGEAYVTFPVGAKTLLKIGKQELDTPLVFTERWSPTPNTFNAAVAINNSIDNLTLIGAFVGQDNTGASMTGPTSFAANGEVIRQLNPSGAYAVGALYKNAGLSVNVWGYELSSLANAVWIDAAMKVGPATVKAYAAQMMPKGYASTLDNTTALALSGGMKAGSVSLFAAASNVSDDNGLAVANVSTFKKTKLPTMAVYLDGRSVAAPGATAIKLKAATKVAGTGLALQGVMVDNDNGVATDLVAGAGESATEIDLIVSRKFGDVNMKAIVMHRDFDKVDAHQHLRVVASVNF